MSGRDGIRKRDRFKFWIKKSSKSDPQVSNDATGGTAPQTQGSLDHVRSAREIRARSLWDAAINELSSDNKTICDNLAGSNLDILGSLYTDVDRKRELCGEDRWCINFLGKQYVLREVFENILVHIRDFREIVDMIVSWDPVHMALPWAAVKLLLQITIGGKEQENLMTLGLEKIACLICRSSVYEKLLLEKNQEVPPSVHSQSNLRAALLKLYTEILTFLTSTIKILSQNVVKRSLTAWLTAERLAKQLQTLDALVLNVAVEAQNQTTVQLFDGQSKMQQLLERMSQPMFSIDSEVSEIHQGLDGKKREEILRWISNQPYERHHYSAKKGRTKGTGKWLLQHEKYQFWRDSAASGMLWLHGSSGVGKTKLATRVIDDLSEKDGSEDIGLIYFYCDRNQSDRGDVAAIFANFVRQLTSNANSLSTASFIVDLYDQKQKDGFPSGSLSIEESTKLFSQLAIVLPKLYVVVDALDECSRDSRLQLVNLLSAEISRSSNIIKVFLTSRPDKDIKDRLRLGPNHEISSSDNQEDITAYIQDQIYNESPSWWVGHVDEDLKRHICQVLISRCQGMFQWAVLQIDQLFKLGLRDEILDRLGKLPTGLEKSYREIYEQIERKEGIAPVIAARAFRWVMCSFDAPSSRMLEAAVSQDPLCSAICPVEDINAEYILGACQNLLVHLKIEDVDEFRFAHLSVREYLEIHLAATSLSHAFVGRICLTVLMDPLFQAAGEEHPPEIDVREWYGAALVGKLNGRAGRKQSLHTEDANIWVSKVKAKGGQRFLRRLFPLVKYARYHWAWHLENAGCVAFGKELDPRDLLEGFFGNFNQTAFPFECWAAFYEKYRDEPAAVPGVRWGYYPRSWHRSFQPFPGKLFFAICMTGLDTVTQGHWSRYPLTEGWLDLNGNTLIEAASSTGCFAMARFALEHSQTYDLEVLQRCIACVNRPPGIYYWGSEMERLLLENGADDSAGNGKFRNALESAFDTGDVSYLGQLIERGMDVNTAGGHKGYALQEAARKGHMGVMRLLLEQGADVDACSDSVCAIHVAAANGKLDVVEVLLDFGADINVCGGNQCHALRGAVEGKDMDIIKLLLVRGPNEVARKSALCAAASTDLTDIVELLLNYRSSFDVGEDSLNPILLSAIDGKALKSLRLLLSHGADPNAHSSDFESAIYLAACVGSADIVRLLVERGADVNAFGGKLGYPLQAATSTPEIVEILLDSGANIDARGGEYGSAIQAAADSKNFESVRLLIDRGADVNASGGMYGGALLAALVFNVFDQQTALLSAGLENSAIALLLLEHGARADVYGGPHGYSVQAAIITRCFDVVTVLLDKGANVNAHAGKLGYPLQAAASIGAFSTVKLLLDRGADVGARGGLYDNALQAGASSQDVDLTELLLNHGAEINAQGGKHGTSLHAAVSAGDLDTVQLLIARGANINATDSEHKTCLALLKTSDYNLRGEVVRARMIKLLRRHGAVEEIEETVKSDKGEKVDTGKNDAL